MAASTHFRRHLPLVLLLAWVAVDMLLPFAAIFIHAGPPPLFLHSPIFTFPALAQTAALGGWLIIGSSHKGSYGAAVAGFVLTIATLLDAETAGLALGRTGVWLLPLLLLRLGGWSFQFAEQPRQRSMTQVSIGELVGLTTVVACALGAWQGLALVDGVLFQPFFESLGMLVLLLLPTVLWPLLAWTRARHSLCICVAIAIVSAQIAATAGWQTPREHRIAFGFVLLSFALFIAHVMALRLAGYSLRRSQGLAVILTGSGNAELGTRNAE